MVDRTTFLRVGFDVPGASIFLDPAKVSPVFAARTVTPAAPNKPTGLASALLDYQTVRLTWTPPSTGVVTGYIVEIRFSAGGPWSNYLFESTTPQADVQIAVGAYDFRVTAYGKGGLGQPSDPVSRTVPWTPDRLGAAWRLSIDPREAATLDANAVSTGFVTTINDPRGSRLFSQGVTGAKPGYGPTAFVGRPGLIGDGVDKNLLYAGDPALPPEFDLMLLFNQTRPASTVSTDRILAFGTGLGASTFELRRAVVSGVNRLQVLNSSVTITNLNVAFDGPCLIWIKVRAATTEAILNQVGMTPVAATPAIGTTRFRIFGNAGASASNLSEGVLGLLAATDPLAGADATQMLAYLLGRMS